MSPPATAFTCFNAMTIDAAHLTFGYFCFYNGPGSTTKHSRYIGGFAASHMIKLKAACISKATINTRMGREVGIKPLFIFSIHTGITDASAIKVDLLVVSVMLFIEFC